MKPSSNTLAVFVVLATIWCQAEARIVEKIWDIDEPVGENVVRCRITCLEKFLLVDVANMSETRDACSSTPDCFMCWDFCRILHEEKRTIGKLMCTNPTCVSMKVHSFRVYLLILFRILVLQFSGCKYACFYHDYLPWLNVIPVASVIVT